MRIRLALLARDTGQDLTLKGSESIVASGKLEGDILPPSETIAIMETLDTVRGIIGLTYPAYTGDVNLVTPGVLGFIAIAVITRVGSPSDSSASHKASALITVASIPM